MAVKTPTIPGLLFTRIIFSIPLLVVTFALLYFILADIGVSTLVWALYIAFIVLTTVSRVMDGSFTTLLNQELIKQEVLLYFSQHGYGSTIGK